MQNWKTTASGLFMCLVALIYIGAKVLHGQPVTDQDLVILGLGTGGGIKGWFAADAKPKDPPQ